MFFRNMSFDVRINNKNILNWTELNFFFSQKLKNCLPCQDLYPGPPQYQAAMLTIELWRLDGALNNDF